MYGPKAKAENTRVVSHKLRPVARRQRQPFFFRLGPVPLCVISVLLIGLMAVLYLGQLGLAVAANQNLQDMRNEQLKLQRQDQDLLDQIAQEQSPGYIILNAKKQGLVPADPKQIWVIPIHNLHPIPRHDLSMLP